MFAMAVRAANRPGLIPNKRLNVHLFRTWAYSCFVSMCRIGKIYVHFQIALEASTTWCRIQIKCRQSIVAGVTVLASFWEVKTRLYSTIEWAPSGAVWPADGGRHMKRWSGFGQRQCGAQVRFSAVACGAGANAVYTVSWRLSIGSLSGPQQGDHTLHCLRMMGYVCGRVCVCVPDHQQFSFIYRLGRHGRHGR